MREFFKRYSLISVYRKQSLDIVTNKIYYPISTFICTLFSYTKITPNGITGLGVLSELIAVWLILSSFNENNLLAVFLLQLGWLFDLSDGMMARYKKMGYYHPSKPNLKGYYFDAISDHILKFIILGALAYVYAKTGSNAWKLGLLIIIIHSITQTEHTIRSMILKNLKKIEKTLPPKNILGEIALIFNNIYLFYIVFLSFSRIDLLFIVFGVGELILLLKRIIKFWLSGN